MITVAASEMITVAASEMITVAAKIKVGPGHWGAGQGLHGEQG